MDARPTLQQQPRTRQLIAVTLAVLAVPLTFLSIFDPLEGGMALLGTFVLNRVIRAVSGVPTNRLYLRGFIVSFVIGATALAFAVALNTDGGKTSDAVMAMAYVYAASTLVVTAGAAKYAWDLLEAYRAGSAPAR